MGPMPAGGVHVDTPSFRGLMRSELPVWLLYVMGASHLFERWMMYVAGGLTWFYEGDDGRYEFWSRGLDNEPEIVGAPFGNEAVVADNDRMPHRVCRIGDSADFASRVRMTPDALLEWRDAGWSISSAGDAESRPRAMLSATFWPIFSTAMSRETPAPRMVSMSPSSRRRLAKRMGPTSGHRCRRVVGPQRTHRDRDSSPMRA